MTSIEPLRRLRTDELKILVCCDSSTTLNPKKSIGVHRVPIEDYRILVARVPFRCIVFYGIVCVALGKSIINQAYNASFNKMNVNFNTSWS